MTNRPVFIIGGGGHAKVLIDLLKLLRKQVFGILDNAPERRGTYVCGIPVLGGDEQLDCHRPDQVEIVNGIGSINVDEKRRLIFERFKNKGFSFATLVHPSAILGAETFLAEGTQVMAGAVVQAGSKVGMNTIINTRASIDHDCKIGNHVHIAPGAVLSGGVLIGDGTHLGTGAVVIQGLEIGSNCLVAAGSVVIHNIRSNARVLGLPAREAGEVQ